MATGAVTLGARQFFELGKLFPEVPRHVLEDIFEHGLQRRSWRCLGLLDGNGDLRIDGPFELGLPFVVP